MQNLWLPTLEDELIAKRLNVSHKDIPDSWFSINLVKICTKNKIDKLITSRKQIKLLKNWIGLQRNVYNLCFEYSKNNKLSGSESDQFLILRSIFDLYEHPIPFPKSLEDIIIYQFIHDYNNNKKTI